MLRFFVGFQLDNLSKLLLRHITLLICPADSIG